MIINKGQEDKGKLKGYNKSLLRRRKFIEEADVPNQGKRIHYLPNFLVGREENETT